MKLELSLLETFGSHLADGSEALNYRVAQIDPYVSISDQIVLDFSGIRNANSSFINALVAGLISQHGTSIMEILSFKGCNPLIKILVGAAVDLAFQKEGRELPA